VLSFTSQPPIGKRKRARSNCNVEKKCCCAVSQGLSARARSLRGGDQPHDARKFRLLPDSSHAYPEASACGNRSAHYRGAGCLGNRSRFAGDQRLIDLGRALHHNAISRHTRSRANEDHVVYAQSCERHFFDS